MQKEIFQKLLKNLEKHCETVLIGSEVDYRRLIAQRSIDQARFNEIYLFLFPNYQTRYDIFAICLLSNLINKSNCKK